MPEYLIDVQRFWSKVDKSAIDGCWVWTGATCAYGYGRFHAQSGGKDLSLQTHRIAFQLAYGYAPPCVCHRCDNPPCVRPDHLFAGDRSDNNRDMYLKGRHAVQTGALVQAKGSRHHSAKLTESDVPIIRAMYSSGKMTQRQIAARYGVVQRTIARILTNEGWTHV